MGAEPLLAISATVMGLTQIAKAAGVSRPWSKALIAIAFSTLATFLYYLQDGGWAGFTERAAFTYFSTVVEATLGAMGLRTLGGTAQRIIQNNQ